ncbi:MAG: SAF domain-containing protein [Gaiellaceae bacterium]
MRLVALGSVGERTCGGGGPTTLAVSASRRFPWRVPALDARVVTGLVLVAASVLGGIRLAQVSAPGIRVLVAAADLDAGHVLSAGDLRTAEVRAPRAFVESLARAGGRGRPVGCCRRRFARGLAQLSALAIHR